jgi:hypothetical protein
MNVFEGVLKNKFFVGIWLITMVFQVVGVLCFGNFLQVSDKGITLHQWLVCILAGMGEIPWQWVINMVKNLTKEKPGGGTSGGKYESGVLKFGSGKTWLNAKTSQNTAASSADRTASPHEIASQRKIAAKSRAKAPHTL